MTDQLYQKLNNDEGGGLSVGSIDRVSRDGPRDRVGELQSRIKAGPIFDFDKLPASADVSELEVRAYYSDRI